MTLRAFIATQPADREAIFALRYRAYRASRAIDENEGASFSDSFDHQPESFSFGVVGEAGLAGSIRVVFCREGGRRLTAYRAFADAIDDHLEASMRVVEANRFVIEPKLDPATTGAVKLLLFKAVIAAAVVKEVDFYVGAARQKHAGFYERVLFMRALSTQRIYPGLAVPMRLMGGHFPSNYLKVCARWGRRLALEGADAASWRSQLQVPC